MDLTKRTVKQALGFKRDLDLASFFGCTKGAVSNWSDDLPLPALRQWQAKALRPDLFDQTASAEIREGQDDSAARECAPAASDASPLTSEAQ